MLVILQSLGGVSYAKGASRIDHSEDEDEAHAFKGDGKLYGADLVAIACFRLLQLFKMAN